MKKLGIVTIIMALMLLLVSSVSAVDTIFEDHFDTGSFDGVDDKWDVYVGTGTIIHDETDTVLYDGEYGGEDWENTKSLAREGQYAAFMYGPTGIDPIEMSITIKNPIDLTNYESVELTFYWTAESFEEGEFGRLDLFDGSNWNEGVETVISRGDVHKTVEGDYVPVTVPLDSYTTVSDFKIRFVSSMATDGQPPSTEEVMDLFMIDDVTVTGEEVLSNNPPTITSTAITSAIEDQTYTYDVEAEDLDDDTLTYELITYPDGMTINEDTGVITWTPDNEDAEIGDHNVVVKVDDSIDFATQSFTIAVEPVNDAPTVDVSDCTQTNLIEDQEYTCTIDVTDVDDDDADLTLTTSKGTVTKGTAPEWTLTWKPNDEEIGQRNVNFIAEDPLETLGTASFSVFVRPDDTCGDYTLGSDLKIDWDITDDDEDFHPRDSIEIEVDVENYGEEEIEDITVEAILYDTTDGKRIDIVKSEEFDLDEDENEEIELTLEIPEDIDIDNDFIVFVSASGDGDDEEQCDWDHNDDLDFKRRKHDVNIEKVVVSPSTVKTGKTVDVKVDVENVGDRDEEDVYVKLKNGDLGIDKKSELFNIDAYEKGDDDEYSITITFTVPEDAEERNYDLEIQVYDDNDEIYESGSKFVTLFVEGTSTTPPTIPTGAVIISIEGASEKIEQGKAFSIPVKLTNTADETKEYTITVSNIADWAGSTSEKVSYLTVAGTQGDSETQYLTITPNEDATEGKHSVTITIKEGTAVIATKTLSFTIPETTDTSITGGTVIDVETEGEGFFHNLFNGTTLLWIIGDLILVVVAIFFIKMLFNKRS